MPVSSREFYTEVPFELELDGRLLLGADFFDRVGKLERIVNMSGLLIASPKLGSQAKVKHTYQYARRMRASCDLQATTFFSHDLTPAAGAPGKGRGGI